MYLMSKVMKHVTAVEGEIFSSKLPVHVKIRHCVMHVDVAIITW